ncbi:hypothetical protein HMPREF9624_00353 [Oribacterium asaccharolyticum ACB7]|uniref:DNA mismatch repair protein MutL n=1 Tax=Oribacterium asaccharolyticum ACB7 TaxID=796944 RepID=G9WUM8_9FIRM|nr:DNA mismatch repair endonuclease MutL [Oribacterium asaccharolyticum]EHL12046.1 hypothetical protein HMPREF9624_00353 [Oribacterium asaccharolyticum ACB7]
MKIHVLGTDTVNQIAAGEVIERPSSMVKELVENAVDAHATQITVEIRGGGIEYLRVSDNGDGIGEDDIVNAFLPHATSKIRGISDLNSILSFGFRGEALSSIAAVSDVELITKTKEDFFAHRIQIHGGERGEVEEVAGVDGSSFIIRNLFFNVPARKKFLYSESTESNRVEEMVEKLALANHRVSFHFIRDGKTRFQSIGSPRIEDVVYSIYGKEQSKESLPLEGAYYPSKITGMPTVHIRGILGRPSITRANRQYELFFVNGRFVHDGLLSRALEDAYKPFLMQHKFPFAILFLDLTPNLVDVNVHPQKLEVRFQNRDSIYQAVFNSVNKTLSEANLIDENPLSVFLKEEKKKVEFQSELLLRKESEERAQGLTKDRASEVPKDTERKQENEGTEKPVQPVRYEEFDLTKGLNSIQEGSYSQEKNSFASEKTFTLKEDVVSSQSFGVDKVFDTAFQEKKKDNTPSPEREHLRNEAKETKEGQESLFTAPFLSEEARLSHRIIGEVFQTYWLIEYGNSLYIMDQHAAHEKINFERMMRRKKEKDVFSQNIIPLSIHLSTGEREVLEEYKKEFLEMGYLWEEEPNGISLTAIPVDFPTVRQEEVLLEILDGLMEDSAILEGESIYNKIASMSCKAAVKGNQKISVAECDTILQELLQLENPFACPHGRPTIVAFKKQDLEKMFKRIV